MSDYTATRVASDQVIWPPSEPIARERVIYGSPEASTLVLEDSANHQMGLWRVTPGEFVTDHSGYLEYIHVLAGSGTLVDDNGRKTSLSAGVTVLMQPGWKGRWLVRETVTKVFTVINV